MNKRLARRGFVMITMLWVMTVAGVVATATALAGRHTLNAARNRVLRQRAFWIATGCVSRAQAAIDARLREAKSLEEAADVWRILDRSVLPVLRPLDCDIGLEAAGTRLDVNDASHDMLESLFREMGFAERAADLADGIFDWRDTNGPLADDRELAHVRGFENVALFDSVLTVEPGRVSLATAPVTVLVSVPGITRETAERLVMLRDGGTPPSEITAVLPSVSRASADALMARYPEIVRITTANPDAWLLTARAAVGLPPNEVVLTRRLVRAGKRAVVARARSAL